MAEVGRGLSESGPAIWPRVVIQTALALGGSPRAASIAAAAVELSVAAIDVADELMDNDWRGAAADRARAQNAAVALSFLATSCLADLAVELGPERACLITRLLSEGSFACSDGQDLDAVLERTSDVTEDTAFAMTQRKSGSLISMACRVGAAVATSEQSIIDAAGQFGLHVGVVAQLLNDLDDVGADPARRKGDLQQRKKTLPVAYALQCAHEEGVRQILDWYATHEPRPADEEQALVQTFHDIGAQQYAWTVADVHRREALSALSALELTSGRSAVRSLRSFIPATRPRATTKAA
jgi:geranylgeranyl diphosphate synthase type I